MSTARITLGSVFGAVNEAATSVTAVLGTATKGINMVNRFVSDAATKQDARSKVDMHTFKKNMIREAAELQSEADMRVIAYCAQSQDHKQMFETNFNELEALFN